MFAFTEKAIKATMLAQEEARRLGHNFVGIEQILLGLIGEGTGVAAKVLKSMGVNLKDTRIEVEKIIGRGSGFVAVKIPFTPRAKRVWELSSEEAGQLGHNYIGTEHLLLGLIREGEGVAARVLENLGVDLSKVRTQVIEMLGETAEVSAGSRRNRDFVDNVCTPRARRVLQLSSEEADRLGHNYIGTEHLLLGLIGEGTGVAAKVLKSMGVNLKDTRIEVEKIIGRGSGFVAVEIPVSPRAKRVLELSLEARQLDRNYYISTEHLLLGLIKEGEGVAARILENLGVDLSKVRIRVIEMLGETADVSAGYGSSDFIFIEGFCTPEAKRVVELSSEEARRLGHNFIGTEQILLGLIKEGTGVAAKVLKSMGVNLKDTRIEVEKIIGRGSGFVAVEIPFTPRAKRVLELSLEEARQLDCNYIGTEHLLLGLIREGEGAAARVLENLGIDLSKVPIWVIEMLGETT